MVISWISVVSRPHPEHRKVGWVRTSTMSTRERWPASIGSTRSPRFTAYPSHPTSRLVQSARGKVLPPPLGSVLSARAQGYRWGTLPSTYPATPVLPDEPNESAQLAAAVSNVQMTPIGGQQIPVQAMIPFIQIPLHRLLSIHVVEGSANGSQEV